MDSLISLMKNILSGLTLEVEELEKRIKKTGIVSREICDLCVSSNKRWVSEFSAKEKFKLALLEEWLSKTNVFAISQIRSGNQFFKTSIKLVGVVPDYQDEKGYVYAFPDQHDTRSKIFKILSKGMKSFPKVRYYLSNFDIIETCKHFGEEKQNILKIEFQTDEPVRYGELDVIPSDLISGSVIKDKLVLCCERAREIFSYLVKAFVTILFV